jgi:hypothetical protein
MLIYLFISFFIQYLSSTYLHENRISQFKYKWEQHRHLICLGFCHLFYCALEFYQSIGSCLVRLIKKEINKYISILSHSWMFYYFPTAFKQRWKILFDGSIIQSYVVSYPKNWPHISHVFSKSARLKSRTTGFTPGFWWGSCCSSFLVFCLSFVPVSLDCPFLIVPSVFSKHEPSHKQQTQIT